MSITIPKLSLDNVERASRKKYKNEYDKDFELLLKENYPNITIEQLNNEAAEIAINTLSYIDDHPEIKNSDGDLYFEKYGDFEKFEEFTKFTKIGPNIRLWLFLNSANLNDNYEYKTFLRNDYKNGLSEVLTYRFSYIVNGKIKPYWRASQNIIEHFDKRYILSFMKERDANLINELIKSKIKIKKFLQFNVIPPDPIKKIFACITETDPNETYGIQTSIHITEKMNRLSFEKFNKPFIDTIDNYEVLFFNKIEEFVYLRPCVLTLTSMLDNGVDEEIVRLTMNHMIKTNF